MRVQIENVTPTKARQLLLGSEQYQRNVSNAQVAHLARQMLDGKWMLNGETVVVSENNQVLDGQHRLLAVIETGLTVQMMIVYGASQDCFHTLDTGKSRNPGNTMHIAGVKNANNVAALIGFRWKYLKAESRNGSLNMWERPTHGELVEYAKNNAQLVQNAVACSQRIRKVLRGINASTIGGSYVVFSEKTNEEKCKEFFDSLATGKNLDENSSVLTLRNKLITSCVGSSSLKWQVKAAYIFMAYKKYIEQKPLILLRWTEGKDKFPFI